MTQQFHPKYIAHIIENSDWNRYLFILIVIATLYSQGVETTQVSIKRWVSKQNTYICNGLLFSHIMEWNADTGYHMNEPWKHVQS